MKRFLTIAGALIAGYSVSIFAQDPNFPNNPTTANGIMSPHDGAVISTLRAGAAPNANPAISQGKPRGNFLQDPGVPSTFGYPNGQSRVQLDPNYGHRLTRIDSNNRWRFVNYNGQWWYWTPQNSWIYFNGDAWYQYNGAAQSMRTDIRAMK